MLAYLIVPSGGGLQRIPCTIGMDSADNNLSAIIPCPVRDPDSRTAVESWERWQKLPPVGAGKKGRS